MSNKDYAFVPTDSADIVASLEKAYKDITGYEITPASPDKLFISWVADLIIQERVHLNYVGNQNIPSRATGTNLDELGKWIFNFERTGEQAAKCSMKFEISEAMETSIVIPKGTRVTDEGNNLVWATTEDAVIAIGETDVEVMVQCETAGLVGNGYSAGEINILIDVDNIVYFAGCANTTTSDGGCEAQSDEEYYEALRASLASYSTAGSRESYIYWAKSVSEEIADVKVVTPEKEITTVLPLWTNADGKNCAFLGGEGYLVNTLKVWDSNFITEIPYTVEYSEGLLSICVEDTELNSIGVTVTRFEFGEVNIYAINNLGEPVSQTIQDAIYSTCNEDHVRPLTDLVEVADPEIKNYDINLTYYVSRNINKSMSEIEADVKNAVQEYINWQHEKIGRDINPDMLKYLLLKAGVKRCEINSPEYTTLSDGRDNTIPQVACFQTDNVINGGYEDE